MTFSTYIGRFAPSPTGPLHAGSLVAALASLLDARAHHGRWLLRIEDIDPPRCPPGTDQRILQQLQALHLHADEPPQWQSQRYELYANALSQLQEAGWAYPCACTRRDMDAALAAQGIQHERHGERPYPGTCREGLHAKTGRSWRFHTQRYQQKLSASPQPVSPAFRFEGEQLHWQDWRLGALAQDVASTVGDFLLQRAGELWAYQLAVVVDDAAQGISDVVRGADLADNTPRQLLLQHALGLPAPRYLHTPLVLQPDGEKLSKQHGAAAVDTSTPALCFQALQQSAQFLGLPASSANTMDAALAEWAGQWLRLLQAPGNSCAKSA